MLVGIGIKIFGLACAATASILDIASYYRQIAKILRTKKSSQVSSTAYLFKIGKGIPAMIGLIIYANWMGLTMEFIMLMVYITSLVIIIRYKPKDWKLF